MFQKIFLLKGKEKKNQKKIFLFFFFQYDPVFKLKKKDKQTSQGLSGKGRDVGTILNPPKGSNRPRAIFFWGGGGLTPLYLRRIFSLLRFEINY